MSLSTTPLVLQQQVSMRKSQPVRGPFTPRFPLYLLGKTGRPLVSEHEDGKAAIGYSNRRLAISAGRLLLKQGVREVGILSVSTEERFREVVSQLQRHQVQYLIWDDLGESEVREFIDLTKLQ